MKNWWPDLSSNLNGKCHVYHLAGPLVSTAWLAEHLGEPGLIILDGSYKLPGVLPVAADDYAERHIPGAVFFSLSPESLFTRQALGFFGWLEGAPGHAQNRGADDYLEASWPESEDFVAKELRRIYGDFGPRAAFAVTND